MRFDYASQQYIKAQYEYTTVMQTQQGFKHNL